MSKRTKTAKHSGCTHPPERLFAWHAYDGTLCVGCCQCGKVLQGGVNLHESEQDTTQENNA